MKNIISLEFRDFKKQLLEKQVNSLKRKSEEEKNMPFTYNGNQKGLIFLISFEKIIIRHKRIGYDFCVSLHAK